MAATLSHASPSTTKTFSSKQDSVAFPVIASRTLKWSKAMMVGYRAGRMVAHAQQPLTPEGISEKVEQSIKEAEEACAEDPASGECAAAWDEVEELSAAASHARDRLVAADPLETFCKENPEDEECRTYED